MEESMMMNDMKRTKRMMLREEVPIKTLILSLRTTKSQIYAMNLSKSSIQKFQEVQVMKKLGSEGFFEKEDPAG
jgi:hypothetical protein